MEEDLDFMADSAFISSSTDGLNRIEDPYTPFCITESVDLPSLEPVSISIPVSSDYDTTNFEVDSGIPGAYDTVEFRVDPGDSTRANTTANFSSYAIPNSKDMMDTQPLPTGLLLSPCVRLVPPPPFLPTSISSCLKCGIYVNTYCNILIQSKQWRCIFCSNVNKFSHHNNVDLNTRPEVTKKVIEFVFDDDEKDMTGDCHPKCSSHDIHTGLGDTYLFVIDCNVHQASFQELRKALAEVVSNLPQDSCIGLITFSNVINFYNLFERGSACAHVISGAESPSTEDLKYLLGVGNESGQDQIRPLTHLFGCREAFLETLEAIEALLPYKQLSCSGIRCAGPAIEVALAFIQDNASRFNDQDGASRFTSGRSYITLCLTGCPNFGPGRMEKFDPNSAVHQAADEYFRKQSARAAHWNSTINCFCVGYQSFSVRGLRSLVAYSGGEIYIEEDFGSNFEKNLRFALFRPIGHDGTLEIRTLSNIGITRIIGVDAEILPDSSQDSSVNVVKVQLSACRPDQSIALYFEILEDIPRDYVFFQFIVTYTNLNKQRIRRIITRRVRTTGSKQSFLRSLDVDVVVLLMAKRSVLMANKKKDVLNVTSVRDDLDDQIREIVLHVGQREERTENHIQSTVYILPEGGLSILPLMLYHLRRGPLLGSTVFVHEDEIEPLRNLFLKANKDDSLRLMMPRLYSFTSLEQEPEQLPVETLALQSDRILYLDCHTHIFVWSGRDVVGSQYDVFREAFKQRGNAESKYRLPAPKMIICNEDSSNARWLRCRLIPSHKDAPHIQLQHFPQLKQIPNKRRKELMAKFLPTDDITFYQYYTELFTENPEGNKR